MNQVEAALIASLASLGQQYENGNRDVSFLTDYLKALLTASMNEKAQEVCVALFKVLPDTEKSNREYWFIFKDQALSPVGSPFMDFLFSHFEQFTRSMGEEKVLNRIAEAFEIKLRDIIRGREPMDDLDKVAKQMAPHHFNSRERMDTYVALGKALREARKDNSEKGWRNYWNYARMNFPRLTGNIWCIFIFP
ncbi:MAG: hypothetical protein ACLU4N_23655 [Butyricimonas faecihominis]